MRQSLWGRILAAITRNAKQLIIWGIVVVVCLAVGFLVYDTVYNFFLNDDYQVYDPEGEKIVIDIPEGSTGAEIGEILEAAGLVDNGTLFRYKAQFLGDSEDFQYGTYTLIAGMGYSDICEVLKTGCKAEGVMITITPGMTIEQVGQMLQDMDICTKSAFIKACESTEYDFDFYSSITNPDYRRHLLEGYLFADTIEIIPQEGVETIVKRLLRHTELVFTNAKRAARLKELGVSVDWVLTMASVVEKEANSVADMGKVARVFYNRNKEGMEWASDPTVWYALGEEENAGLNLTYDQIWEASYPNCKYYRYNTYLGLGNQNDNPDGFWLKPVGPICNPSVAAIDAVLYPTAGKWLYFASKDGKTTRFFNTYAEMDAWVNG